MPDTSAYRPKHPIRIVSAASLFDGHDASINVMRRLMQQLGAEVIHLGHNRSAREVAECAVQEDAQLVALTSYQGGHVEYFTYLRELLDARGAPHVRIVGGGGGTILPQEIELLHARGITRIYSPDDGRTLGLEGMIAEVIRYADFVPEIREPETLSARVAARDAAAIAQAISLVERGELQVGSGALVEKRHSRKVPVLGITGTGGAGKSSLTDELVRRFLADFPDKTVAVLSVDPSKRRTGGALLGDRIRMNTASDPRVYVRSMATREANVALARGVRGALAVLDAAGFDLLLVETAGIGQSDSAITEVADVALYVMTPEYGAATQLEKIDMLDYADVVALNKFDKRGSEDAIRDVRKQLQRAKRRFDVAPEAMPVYGCIAAQYGDPGVDRLYRALVTTLTERCSLPWESRLPEPVTSSEKIHLVPPSRQRYLGAIVDAIESYDREVEDAAARARRIQALETARALVGDATATVDAALEKERAAERPEIRAAVERLEARESDYRQDTVGYLVRGKEVRVSAQSTTLSGTRIPKVAVPRLEDAGARVRFAMQENVPGEFPYTAGVYPFKRTEEDPTRMFAGEGGPERTNRRFHYLSKGMAATRLSTAFDSVTLYGENPDERPDIFGKIGNSGVNVATLDDAKKLYSGFDLLAPTTSVSMTINGPAPMVLAFFLNAAIDQVCERHIRATGLEAAVREKIERKYRSLGRPAPQYGGDLPEGHDGLGLLLLGVTGDEVLDAETYGRCRAEALSSVRGTVQADILKEDQAQNTCIFSTEFALRLMGDIQETFIRERVRNFYSVSVSGYHMAEAGATPVTQLAFTLANGFTLAEHYLSRGMPVDAFAPNFSFFFSNGVDAEYAVIGRVARRIWAKAMRRHYGANERSQMLKYHIQTSGRSLHAQEIAFNDIRTTLQALYALEDNCNSLHTNAYDEAITTPTEESVRRAMAIQLIINKELGTSKNENPRQGAYFVEALTDAVEAAVLAELRRLDERGGVLGAMERGYQRSKIQDESMTYERMKHSGELPIIGVNTFLDAEGSKTRIPETVIRSTDDEKRAQIENLRAFDERGASVAEARLAGLASAARRRDNAFDELLEVVKVASLGRISHALYDVGGQYRRNV